MKIGIDPDLNEGSNVCFSFFIFLFNNVRLYICLDTIQIANCKRTKG